MADRFPPGPAATHGGGAVPRGADGAARTLGQLLQPSLGRPGDAPAARPLLEDCARRGPAGRAGARDAGAVAANRSRAARQLALATRSRSARGNAMGWLGFLLGALVGAYVHG